ncbi:MAG: hypothetical protein A2252_11470 [Elusimicrobia bacterium RIFOXYA2_FULL_39_19]|nr:MAG: hypothetical protein A2252_11470 [Elusimicrobia bacterium RIFOXYA2_FULL_39_19]
MLNEDYKEMLRAFTGNKVKFLVVGAYAMGVYGYPRATGDFDIWVEATPENSKNIYKALKQFGAPLAEISTATFAEKGIVFQIGVAPRRIDVLTQIDGVNFKQAYKAKEEVVIDGTKIPFLSKKHLIKNKKTTYREKDRIDINCLKNKFLK